MRYLVYQRRNEQGELEQIVAPYRRSALEKALKEAEGDIIPEDDEPLWEQE